MHYSNNQAATIASAASTLRDPVPPAEHECHTNQQISNSSASKQPKASKLIIFPVTVYSNNLKHSKNVFAFVDSGSDCSYITDALAQDLQVSGERTLLHMGTMNGTRHDWCQRIEGLQVAKLNSTEVKRLPSMYTRDRIPVDLENIPWRDDFKDYKHMDVFRRLRRLWKWDCLVIRQQRFRCHTCARHKDRRWVWAFRNSHASWMDTTWILKRIKRCCYRSLHQQGRRCRAGHASKGDQQRVPWASSRWAKATLTRRQAVPADRSKDRSEERRQDTSGSACQRWYKTSRQQEDGWKEVVVSQAKNGEE